MKAIILTLSLLAMTFSARAFDRKAANELLAKRNLSLQSFERQGSELLLGEVTGGGRAINEEQLRAIFIKEQVILKHEIESMSFKGSNILSELDSFRAHGLYFTKEDIQAIIIQK